MRRDAKELIIALLKPYAGRECINDISTALDEANVTYRVLYTYGKRVLIAVRGALPVNPCALLHRARCVSRAVHVYAVETPGVWSLDKVCSLCVRACRDLVSMENVTHVDVRRWDKSKPFTSLELGLCIARELGLKLASGSSWKTLFVGIDSDRIFMGLMYKCSPISTANMLRGIVAVVEPLETLYEMMDLVQLSRALSIELRLLGGNRVRKLLRQALEVLGISSEEPQVSVLDTAAEALRDVDAYVVLTPYGDHNEQVLARIASDYARIALILGSETRDVREELRRGALAEVRLGPPSSKPMRTSTALAYALGVVALARLSYG